MTRIRLPVSALYAIAAAAALAVLAVDAIRVDRGLDGADAHFEAAPARAKSWQVGAALPDGVVTHALAVDDDLAYRDAMLRYARALSPSVFGDRAETLRGEAQLALTRVSQGDPDPRRRSAAANLLGVLALEGTTYLPSAEERAQILAGAIGNFQNAVELDDGNDTAKRNLELALRDAGPGIQIPGDEPSGQRAEGESSGVGRTGTGY